MFTTQDLMFSAMLLIPMSCIPAYIAKKKGRSFLLWYIYAYCFFAMALIHIMILPPKIKREDRVNLQEFNIPDTIVINNRRINYCFIGCPMDTLSYSITAHPHTKTLIVKLNLFAEKPIKAFDITLEMRDSLNNKIADKVFNNIEFAENVEFDISEYVYTMYVNFKVDRIYLANGEEWVKQGEPLEYDIEILDGYELEKLKSMTNSKAVCLPYLEEDYWVCTCAKANNTDACVVCGIDKEELFNKLDKDTILKLRNDLIRRNNLSKFNIARAGGKV